MEYLPQDVQYFLLFSALLVIPKILLRWRIPGGLSALAIGVIASYFIGSFQSDSLVGLLSTLGITSLFLFAGLEVNIGELKADYRFLRKHLIGGLILLLVGGFIIQQFFELPFRASLLLSLGLLTPSTGFILDSLHAYHFSKNEVGWIRSKSIAMELVALIVMFFILQSGSWFELGLSLIAMGMIIFALPPVFRLFLRKITPYAPHSELTFLILLAFLAGVLTREIGTYYLVGAFVVGIIANRCESMLPELRSEQSLQSLRLFFSFFIPFYFFKSGNMIDLEKTSFEGLLTGVAFLLVFVPIRLLSMMSSIRYLHEEKLQKVLQISISTLPTLVFGLVIAEILHEEYQISSRLFTGLIVYTVVISALPSIFLKKRPVRELFDPI